MRILQICSARTLGGGERHVAGLANALAERGHDVYAAVAPHSPLVETLAKVPDRNIIRLRMRNAFDVMSALRLARFIREHKIDIVHAHLARDYPLASLAVRRYARLVITRHVLFPLNRLHAVTLKKVAGVIAVSDAVARSLRARRVVDPAVIRMIHNGIDFARFDDASTNAACDALREMGVRARFMVGTVGSLLPMKGHEDFARAAASILTRRDDVDFVIIGDDEARNRPHREKLEALIEKLSLGEHVRLMHWPEDVAPLYAAFDVYVSASHTEAFGLSIVEAMASGTAVVATATEGAMEIIDDGETGSIVPVGDVEKIAAAITALLENEAARDRLGTRAREVARNNFSIEQMVEATEQVYRTALLEK